MSFWDRLRGKRSPPPAVTEPVRCPTCGEQNPPSALVCTICRGVLPPRPEQQVRSAKQ